MSFVPLLDRIAALALAALVAAPQVANACSVCSAGRDDEAQAAFLGTTAFLSVLPLAIIGGFVWWLRRRMRAMDADGVTSHRADAPASLAS
jgi:hypothetical protein